MTLAGRSRRKINIVASLGCAVQFQLYGPTRQFPINISDPIDQVSCVFNLFSTVGQLFLVVN